MFGLLAGVLKEPIEVQVVEGRSRASEIFFAVIGPLLIAGAAVSAARIAAATANKRQREQLSHDLVVRSMEHIRDAIDEAVEVVHETSKAFADFSISILDWEADRPVLQAELTDEDASPDERDNAHESLVTQLNEVTDRHNAALDRLVELIAISTRLKLRLGSDHEIPKLSESLRIAWNELAALLLKGQTGSRTSQEIVETETKENEAGEIYNEFHLACERWLTEGREAHLYPSLASAH